MLWRKHNNIPRYSALRVLHGVVRVRLCATVVMCVVRLVRLVAVAVTVIIAFAVITVAQAVTCYHVLQKAHVQAWQQGTK